MTSTASSSHSHANTALDAALAALDKRVVALEARVTALEKPPVVVPPPAWTWPTLQAAIDATATGGTLDATGRTFTERVRITKPMTLVGGTVVGTGLGVPLQQGVLTVAANDVFLRGVRMTGSAGAGVDVSGRQRVTLIGCELDNNIQQGYHVTGSADVTFQDCHIHHNNVALTVDPLWEAGGGKATNCQRVNFRGCEVDHNGGPGLWTDINGDAVLIEGCRIHHNTHAGVMHEISDGATIRNNSVWENGWKDNRGWGWPAGILVSSAANATVSGNTVAWCAVGIALVSQNRADFTKPHAGNSATGNLVTVSAGRTPVANYVDWADPSPRPPVSPNTIPASAAQLTAAGIPTAPEAGH